MPSTSLRLLQPGDHWRYSLNVTASGISIPGGSLDLTIGNGVLNGASVLSLTEVVNVSSFGSFSGGSVSGVTYLRQDPSTHDVSYVGDNAGIGGANRTVTSDTGVFVPGTWEANTATTDHLVFNDGLSQDLAVTVTGQENLLTPIGTFPVWRANQVVGLAGSAPQSVSIWMDPALGEPLKIQGTVNISGMNYSIAGVLSSTNVPLQ